MPAERAVKVKLHSARRRRAGSTRWLTRQLNDPYVQQARQEGYRSRAAYKLLEVDQKHRLLKPGLRVIDLGSAPGGWLQVAGRRGCRVVGLDLEPIAPIDGATVLQGDVFEPDTAARLEEALGGPAQLLLSDLAASSTGQRAVDRLRAEALGEAVLALVPELLAPGGNALIKLVRGAEADVVAEARRTFARVRLVRPEATRRESSEIYLLGLRYRGRAPARSETPDQGSPR
jgi:23S rRNA (uridine2552-2'-O)-methyltransferase